MCSANPACAKKKKKNKKKKKKKTHPTKILLKESSHVRESPIPTSWADEYGILCIHIHT